MQRGSHQTARKTRSLRARCWRWPSRRRIGPKWGRFRLLLFKLCHDVDNAIAHLSRAEALRLCFDLRN
jgi:hypothetical protein